MWQSHEFCSLCYGTQRKWNWCGYTLCLIYVKLHVSFIVKRCWIIYFSSSMDYGIVFWSIALNKYCLVYEKRTVQWLIDNQHRQLRGIFTIILKYWFWNIDPIITRLDDGLVVDSNFSISLDFTYWKIWFASGWSRRVLQFSCDEQYSNIDSLIAYIYFLSKSKIYIQIFSLILVKMEKEAEKFGNQKGYWKMIKQ